MPDLLRFAGQVEIKASAGDETKRPTVNILAYGGGVMTVGFYGPTIINLAGLEIPPTIPLLADHNDKLDGIVGAGKPSIENGILNVQGTLAEGATADRIVSLAKAGVPFGASIGVEKLDSQNIPAGQVLKINGKTIKTTRPTMLVNRGRLRETSILSVAADPTSRVDIAASSKQQRGKKMSTETNIGENVNDQLRATLPENNPGLTDPQRVQARWEREKWHNESGPKDRAREAMLQATAGTITYSDFERVLLEEKLRDAELAMIRAERPKGSMVHGSGRDVPGGDPNTIMAAGIMLRAGFSQAAERSFDEPILHAAEKSGRMHLLDFAKCCLQADGRDPPAGREELVKAALSTVSMPKALGLAGEKLLLDAYQQAPAAWRQWCKIVSVASFRDHTLLRPSFMGGFQQVIPGGEIAHAYVGEETATIKADTFGKLLSIDRQMMINDDAGAFGQAAQAMGKADARKIADLVITTLLAGIGSFYTAELGNLIDTPLSLAAVASAVAILRARVNADGDCLDIIPKVLVVGPAFESLARAICESEFVGVTDGSPTGNSMRGVLVPVVEPRFANSAIPGASAAAWAVLAGPIDAPQAVCFLNGIENPTVEELGLQAEVDRLVYSWRAYHDFGSALLDFRASVPSTGKGQEE